MSDVTAAPVTEGTTGKQPVGETSNTRGTYAKATALSIVLGLPLYFVGTSILRTAGAYAGCAVATWVAGRIVGLRGKRAHILVFIATFLAVTLPIVALIFLGSQVQAIR